MLGITIPLMSSKCVPLAVGEVYWGVPEKTAAIGCFFQVVRRSRYFPGYLVRELRTATNRTRYMYCRAITYVPYLPLEDNKLHTVLESKNRWMVQTREDGCIYYLRSFFGKTVTEYQNPKGWYFYDKDAAECSDSEEEDIEAALYAKFCKSLEVAQSNSKEKK